MKKRTVLSLSLLLMSCGITNNRDRVIVNPPNDEITEKKCKVDFDNQCYEIFDATNVEYYDKNAWMIDGQKLISIGKLDDIRRGDEIATFKVTFKESGKYYFYFNANVSDFNNRGKQDSFYIPVDFDSPPFIIMDGWGTVYFDQMGIDYMSNKPTWYKTNIYYEVTSIHNELTFQIGMRQAGLVINRIMFSENIDMLEIFKRMNDEL